MGLCKWVEPRLLLLEFEEGFGSEIVELRKWVLPKLLFLGFGEGEI